MNSCLNIGLKFSCVLVCEKFCISLFVSIS